MENEIISIARQLVQQGKTPTVALVKGKLSRRVPMPILIQTLQKFDSLSASQLLEIEHHASDKETPAQQPDLEQQVILMRQELNTLQQQVVMLTTTVERLSNAEASSS